jgi:hypothetical protein
LGTAPYLFEWNDGAAAVVNPVVTPVVSSSYAVTVTDSKGCTAISNALITVHPIPAANAGANVTVPNCSPTGVTIGGAPTATGGAGGTFTYRWSPSNGLTDSTAANPNVHGILTTTTYTVVVTDSNGCTASSQVVVSVSNTAPLVSIRLLMHGQVVLIYRH